MTEVTIACFILIALILASCFRRGADVLSPGRVFALVWALCIGLADLKFSRFQETWTLFGWAMLVLGLVAFLIGLFVAYVMYLRTPLLSIAEVRTRVQVQARESLDPTRFFRATVFLFCAYIAAYAIEVFIVGNVPMFAANPERLRVGYGVFGLHLFVTAMLSILLFGIEYWLLLPHTKGRSAVLLLMCFVTFVTFFLLLQRYSFFIWACIALGLTYYASRKLRFRTLLATAGVFLGLLTFIQSFRTAHYVEHYLYVVSRMKFSREYAVFTEPYMYLVTNLENYARAAEKLDHVYFGYFTFDWVVALTGLKHWIGEYFGIVRLPFLNSDYNTFPFHWWYYYDFGPVGVTVIPLLLGLAVGLAYYRLRTTPTVMTLYVYSIALMIMVNSYRDNALTRLDFVSNLFFIWIVHRHLASRPVAAKPGAGSGQPGEQETGST